MMCGAITITAPHEHWIKWWCNCARRSAIIAIHRSICSPCTAWATSCRFEAREKQFARGAESAAQHSRNKQKMTHAERSERDKRRAAMNNLPTWQLDQGAGVIC